MGSCGTVQGFYLLCDYILFKPGTGSWFISVYSYKQCQCSRLWQTLNGTAIVINTLLLMHLSFFFFKWDLEINVRLCCDFISVTKVRMNSTSPRTTALPFVQRMNRANHINTLSLFDLITYCAVTVPINVCLVWCLCRSLQQYLAQAQTNYCPKVLSLCFGFSKMYILSIYLALCAKSLRTCKQHVQLCFWWRPENQINKLWTDIWLWDVINSAFHSSAVKHNSFSQKRVDRISAAGFPFQF